LSSFKQAGFSVSTSSPLSSNLQQRLITGFLVAGVALAMVFWGGWAWVAFVVFVFLTGFQELTVLMRAKDIRPSQVIVLTVGLMLILLAGAGKERYFPEVLTTGVIASFIRLLFRDPDPKGSIADIGATLLGIFYTAYLPAHFILLREMGRDISSSIPWEQPGFGYLVFTVFVVSLSDIGAYFAGKRFGKNLLYPAISPKKTREGAWIGLVCGVLGGQIVANFIQFSWDHALILSILLVIIGQLGDLSESLLKRDAGIKDSGALLKGHGGILDRVDSFIFSGAVCYYYVHWVVLQQGLMQDMLHLLSRMPLP
jgi:phosphatidate cytidylyltransferase